MGRAAWMLSRRQHAVVTRRQLLALGFSRHAIAHRLSTGRLHRVGRGVYAVGRPDLTREGRWLAAVLACGPHAVLSHASAAALWEIAPLPRGPVEVSVPLPADPRRPGIRAHRRRGLEAGDVTRRRGIPVTRPAATLVDLAARLPRDRLEAAVIEADKRGLIDPEELRKVLDALTPRPGVRALRTALDRRTYTLTDSELERRFLPIARRAGLPAPQTQSMVNGFRVDFHWPALGLVVETDGLRYHRTAVQQARDRVRDQAHAAAGLTALRFTHGQVSFGPRRVQETLAAVTARLRDARPGVDGATASG